MEIQIPYNFDPTKRPYQEQIFKDPRKNKVIVIHRKAGKTSLVINKLISQAIVNPAKVFWYVCPTQKQAKDIVWKAPDMLNQYVPPFAIEKKNEIELTLYFKNKSQIQIKGADEPDSLRGPNPYGVALDEYAQMKKEVYDEVLRPVLIANNGWCWFVGTPKGKNDFYHKFKYAESNPKDWQAILLRADETNILSQAQLEEAKSTMVQSAFSQEFLCEFLENSGNIFRRIRENISGKLEEPKRSRQYKMGVDLARVLDFTVITVVDRHTHELVYFDRFNQIDWQLQKARIEAVARRYNNATITIDSTGVGDPIAEDLRKLGLIIQDVKFTSISKKNIIENLAIMIEQDRIKYPEIPVLIKELEEFTYELLPSGQVRYTAPEGLHDDCVCSLALACWQIGEKIPISVQPQSYGLDFNLRGSGYKKLVFK